MNQTTATDCKVKRPKLKVVDPLSNSEPTQRLAFECPVSIKEDIQTAARSEGKSLKAFMVDHFKFGAYQLLSFSSSIKQRICETAQKKNKSPTAVLSEAFLFYCSYRDLIYHNRDAKSR